MVEGVRGVAHDDNSPEESHDGWMRHRKSEGWVYGEKKCTTAKTHPCLVPYDSMPIEHRAKDEIFVRVAKAMLAAFNAAPLDVDTKTA